MRNGTPCSTLPKATPNTSAGTSPPANSAQSQNVRQRASLHLAAELEADRAQDQRRQHQEHGDVEAGERRPHRAAGRPRRSRRRRVISQTWLPSQTGPMVLMATRRSLSFLATKGSSAATPRSKPSMMAKPISSTPRNSPPDHAKDFIVDGNGHGVLLHAPVLRRSAGAGEDPSASTGPISDVFAHQDDVDDQQARVEQDEAAQREQHLRDRHRGDGEEGRQHAVDRPGLAAVFGDDPAELGGDPGQRQRPKEQPQQPPAREVELGRVARRRSRTAR